MAYQLVDQHVDRQQEPETICVRHTNKICWSIHNEYSARDITTEIHEDKYVLCFVASSFHLENPATARYTKNKTLHPKLHTL